MDKEFEDLSEVIKAVLAERNIIAEISAGLLQRAIVADIQVSQVPIDLDQVAREIRERLGASK